MSDPRINAMTDNRIDKFHRELLTVISILQMSRTLCAVFFGVESDFLEREGAAGSVRS